jgi:2-polyprenyl-3-methyl-5-hydroxy-6-metoxy-1,4-benzoquinol methylase
VSGQRYQLKEDPYSSHSAILALLGPGRGRRALDVGAADGFLAERLTAQGWLVTALERDPLQAERARSRCHEVVVADLAEGAAPLSGRFDAIVYGDVLEHVPDPLRVLASLNRHLSPAGRVIVSVPNVAHLWVRLSLLAGRFDYAERGILDRTHLRFFTRRTLRALLAEAGLAVDEMRVTPVPLPTVVPRRLHGPWLDALHTASAWASRQWPRGLAYQFVAACRPTWPPDAAPGQDAGDRFRARAAERV